MMSSNAHLAQDSGSLSQGIFSDHWNSLARWHFSIPLETHSAVKQAEECGTKLFALRKDLRLSTQSEGGLL